MEYEPMVRLLEESEARSVTLQPQLQAVSARFCGRGLSRAVQTETEEQVRRELSTRECFPEAYRLSRLSESVINLKYRRGGTEMGSAGLCAYFADVRARRVREENFAELPASDEAILAGDADKPCVRSVRSEAPCSVASRLHALPSELRRLPSATKERILLGAPTWFDRGGSNTERETHRFPLSAFAAIFAVAISLMLIVAGSVMVHQGERSVQALALELEEVGAEVAELRSDLSADTDLLGVREIAVCEYGMVSEEYLRMHYLHRDQIDSIEVYKEEREESVGLDALLSAMGIK